MRVGLNTKNKGFLFVGSSGRGKSTLANLFKKEKDAEILNDDRVAIRKIKSCFWIYGTPWHGERKLYSFCKASLEKNIFFKHAKVNTLKKISLTKALPRLIAFSFPPFWDKDKMKFNLEFYYNLAKNIFIYELGFVPQKKVIEFLKNEALY